MCLKIMFLHCPITELCFLFQYFGTATHSYLNYGDGPFVVDILKEMTSKTFYSDRTVGSLTLCLPVSSADNLGKQFGPRSGPTNCHA